MANYNISTKYENQENNDDRNFLEKTIDAIWWAAHVVSNRLFWDKDASIKKAQDAQIQIDDLKDRYYNWNYTSIEKNQIATKISDLSKIRDDALSSNDLWASDRWDRLMRQWNPITENDIYEYSRNQAHSTEDYNAIKSEAGNSLSGFLKSTMKANNATTTNNFINQAKKDLQEWKTTQEDIASWKYFAQIWGMQDKWTWFDWYLRNFLSDTATMVTPSNFTLQDNNWISYFFKDDAARVLEIITTSDDIMKAVQNNYNVVKKVEERMNSEDWWERKFAEWERVQEIYKTAVKNLNNLKKEVAYTYDNFWRFNWDMFAIEEQFYKDNWRKMFSNADTSVRFKSKDETYTSEDWATAAVHDLNVYWDDFIQHEYPNTREAVKGNLLSPFKRWFDNIAYISNQVRDSFQESSDELAVLSNTVYWTIWMLAELDFSLSDLWDILTLQQSRIPLADITKESYEMAKTTQMWMWSLRSIKQALTYDDSTWNKMYNDALAFADLSPTLSKEAFAFALTEWMLDSIWVVWTADMMKATAEWSTQYAKLVAWNKELWWMQFDTQWLVYAKLHEFVWRWLAQNYLLSASAMWNFSEDYSDFDFWMDIAFWMIDVFTLWHTFLWWKWKIANEARKSIMRTAFRDSLRITDDQWQIIMSTSQWRKMVDKLAWDMWNMAVKSIDTLAENKWVTRDEIISEISKAVKQTRKNWWWEAMKLYRQQRNQLLAQLENVTNWALVKAVYGNSKNLPQSILDKIGTREVKDINWDILEVPYWKKKITATEFLTILKESNVPALSKLWNQIQNIRKSWSKVKETLEDRLEELKKIDRTTEQWRIQYDIKVRELEKDYNKLLKDKLLEPKTYKNLEESIYADPNMYRRWEYEKYWRPNWYAYWDIEYTYIWQTATKEEARELLSQRVKEYITEIEDLIKDAREKWISDYQYVRWLTSASIEMSDRLTWKQNLIWLSFDEACKINPKLANLWEWFFIEVSSADWLELYQKNMILWSWISDYKIPNDAWWIVIEFRKWDNQLFWSMFEQEYFLWKAWWMWEVFLEDQKLKWVYWIIRSRDWIYKLTIKDEKGWIYKFNIVDWKVRMDKSTSKKTWGEINISFKPNWADKSSTTWQRYSWNFELYWEQWKQFNENMWKKLKETPFEQHVLSTLQKAEIALKQNLNSWEFKWKKEWRNRYQWEKAKNTFKDNNMLSSSQMKSWYLDILWYFDVPYSYYIEVKMMIREWVITEREWAALLLSASWSNIAENADYFILWKWAKLKWNLQLFAMHQCWVVALPFGDVKEWWYKLYFYEREEWRSWMYRLYWTNSSTVKLWDLWINPETGTAMVRFNWWEVLQVEDYRIDKHISADVDSKKYALTNRKNRYKNKRDEAYQQFLKKSEQWVYNFNPIVETDQVSRFRRITKWDNRWLYTSFNKDISIDRWNRKEINDIYRFKNTSLTTWWKNLWLFNSWFRYSLLPKFYKLNFWVNSANEWKAMLLEMKWEWLMKYSKVINIQWEHARIIIDPEWMWFKINYSEFEYWKSKKKWQSLIFRIDDKNIPWWRVVSIDFIWNHKIETIDWQSYLRVVDDKNLDYYIKLDTSIERLDKFDVNTLSLSKEDYQRFIEYPWLTSKLIWASENNYFILKNLFAFPDYIKDIVDRWSTSVEVYNTMKEMIEWNELMSEIFLRNWLEWNTASIADILWVYQEYKDILEAVNRLNEIGTVVPKENMIKYYDQVLSHWIFWNKAITDIFDALWLNDFREAKDSDSISQWMFNYQTLDKKRLKLSWTSYNYMQSRITINRLSEFIDSYNSWEFKTGLDITKPDDYAKYLKRIKTNYEMAIAVVDPSDVRRTYNELLQRSKIKEWAWEITSKNLARVSEQANNISSFWQFLVDLQSWLKWFRKTKTKFTDWDNLWLKLFFNEDGTYRTIEDVAWDIQKLLWEWMDRNELLDRIYYWLLQTCWKKEAIWKISKLEREYLSVINSYKKYYWDIKIKADEIINKWTNPSEWNIYDENFKEYLQEARIYLLAWSTDPNKIKFVDNKLKELEDLWNKIQDWISKWEDVSELEKTFVEEFQAAMTDFNDSRDELMKIQEESKDSVKWDLVESYNETKEVKWELEEAPIFTKEEIEETTQIEKKITEEEEQAEEIELKQEEKEITEQINETDLEEWIEWVENIKQELWEEEHFVKKRKEKQVRKTADKKEIWRDETQDYFWHQRDLTNDANMSQLLWWPEQNWEWLRWLFNDIWYKLDKDWDPVESNVKNSLLLNWTLRQTPRDMWIKYLESWSNFKAFVQSWEWVELMLYALYYHLPVPHKLLRAVDDVYSLWIFSGKIQKINSYDEIYNKLKQSYSLNKWYDVNMTEYWTLSINKWRPRDDLFLKQYDIYSVNLDDTKFKWINIDESKRVEWYQKSIYKTSDIKDPEFSQEYNNFLTNSQERWAYYSSRRNSWPMSMFEYFVLKKIAAVNDDAKRYLENMLKWKWRYLNISYWQWWEWWLWRSMFYEWLDNKEYKEEYSKLVWLNRDNDSFFYSPYYTQKRRDLSNDNIRFSVDTDEIDDLWKPVYEIKFLWKWTNDWTVARQTYVWNFSEFKNNVDTLKKDYDKIIIQWWDINEIKKYLDWNKLDFNYDIRYSDEVIITPRKETQEEIKEAKKATDNNTTNAIRGSCKL